MRPPPPVDPGRETPARSALIKPAILNAFDVKRGRFAYKHATVPRVVFVRLYKVTGTIELKM